MCGQALRQRRSAQRGEVPDADLVKLALDAIAGRGPPVRTGIDRDLGAVVEKDALLRDCQPFRAVGERPPVRGQVKAKLERITALDESLGCQVPVYHPAV